MKTKIKVTNIKDPNTNIPVNSPLHRIEEIKKEISGCFATPNLDTCKTEVLQMWEEK